MLNRQETLTNISSPSLKVKVVKVIRMEDWTYGPAIALCAVLWVMIFVDYRKKLMLVMPSVKHVSSRRHDFSTKISEAEISA